VAAELVGDLQDALALGEEGGCEDSLQRGVAVGKDVLTLKPAPGQPMFLHCLCTEPAVSAAAQSPGVSPHHVCTCPYPHGICWF